MQLKANGIRFQQIRTMKNGRKGKTSEYWVVIITSQSHIIALTDAVSKWECKCIAMVGTRWFIRYPIECNLLWIDNILTPSSIDLAKVVGWKLRFPIASGYRSLILGKSGVFPTTYASTNSQANQVFMTSNGNPNLAVEPDLSTLYLSQIHQTQRNFPGKQWIQCVVTSCKLKGHVLTMTVIDTPMFTKNITIYSILSLTAFKRVKCSWVSWFHNPHCLISCSTRLQRCGEIVCVASYGASFISPALGWAFRKMYCTASFIG